MKLTVTTLSDDIFNVDVSGDMELENFKALCSLETGYPTGEIVIVWNGKPVTDEKRTLSDYGIKEGDVLLLQLMQGVVPSQPTGQDSSRPSKPAAVGGMQLPPIDFSSISIPNTMRAPRQASSAGPSGYGGLPDDPATLMEMLLNSPHDMSLLKERNPALADALLSKNLEKFTEVLQKQNAERAERERERIRMLTADPFDAEAQSKIAEEIRLRNVESNMETAMEFAPESFGQVVMLYIDCKVNDHPVKAFVDSGQIQIGNDYLQSSFSILEDQPMDMLLGLDMLKRHQCSIDLKNNILIIGTTGTTTPFLSESDLPDHARLNRTVSLSDQASEDEQLAKVMAKSQEEQASSGAGNSSSENNPFPESSIQTLTSHGFTRSQVIQKLHEANGNIDQALASLFASSVQGPN